MNQDVVQETERISVVVIEDEAPARNRLVTLVDASPQLSLVATATDGWEAVAVLNDVRPDIAFLDVQMPQLDGFEVLKRVRSAPLVIFTTAYDEYAIQAFEVHAIDYLLKPYSKERFTAAVVRAEQTLHSRDRGGHERRMREMIHSPHEERNYLDRLSVRKGHVYRVVAAVDVVAFKADDGLVFLHTADDRFIVDATLAQLEKELDPAIFLRVHRSSIVNIDHIHNIVPWGHSQLAIEMSNDDRLFVSRGHVDSFRRRMGLRL